MTTKDIDFDTRTNDSFVHLEDGAMHIVDQGGPEAPALLLIHGAAASLACWDPVLPALQGAFRVIRVDLLGHGRSTSPTSGYDIVTQARRVRAALDSLGVQRVTVIGHSTGATVAAALAEQRPDAISAIAIIDMGPDPAAKFSEPRMARLLLTKVPGRLLWCLRTKNTVRKASRSAFSRPIDIPDTLIANVMGMTHQAFAGTMRAPLRYLGQQSLCVRLRSLGLPVLVIFGTDDRRWRSSSANAFQIVPGARIELLPGVGHTPMLEEPQATGQLLGDFATHYGT